jgi:hypothetical protein
MSKFKVQIKQRQCQSTKFKEFSSFPIHLFIAGRDFEIWHSFDIDSPSVHHFVWALTFEL